MKTDYKEYIGFGILARKKTLPTIDFKELDYDQTKSLGAECLELFRQCIERMEELEKQKTYTK